MKVVEWEGRICVRTNLYLKNIYYNIKDMGMNDYDYQT